MMTPGKTHGRVSTMLVRLSGARERSTGRVEEATLRRIR